MTAHTPSAAFTRAITPNATGDVTDAFLAGLVEPAPTVADSIVRSSLLQPIHEQIGIVRRIVESPRWSSMDYRDQQLLDRILTSFEMDQDYAQIGQPDLREETAERREYQARVS